LEPIALVNFFRSRKTTPRLESLRNLSLFINLTPGELQIVDGLLHERDYLADEVIFDEGEEGQAIYIVTFGQVVISRQNHSDGDWLAQLGPGTFFGELALLDNAPRGAQARAATACRVIVFFRDDFVAMLDTHARIASKISRELASHMGARMREMALAVGAYQHL
jgi:CRP-like cAMP-binding protein